MSVHVSLYPLQKGLGEKRTDTFYHGTRSVPYDNRTFPCTLNLDTCGHQSGFSGECYGIDKSPTGSALECCHEQRTLEAGL